MIIVEGRERTGQIDISNIEILVKIKRDIVPETLFSYKNRVFHSPTLCKSSSRGEIHCSSSADNYRGQCGNLILRVYHLGLKTGPGDSDHTSHLLRAVRRN